MKERAAVEVVAEGVDIDEPFGRFWGCKSWGSLGKFWERARVMAMRRVSTCVTVLLVFAFFGNTNALICGPGIPLEVLEATFQQVKDFAASSSQSALIRIDSLGYAWGNTRTIGLTARLQMGGIRTLATHDSTSCVIDEQFKVLTAIDIESTSKPSTERARSTQESDRILSSASSYLVSARAHPKLSPRCRPPEHTVQ